MSSCEDMLYSNLGYHCKGFGAADTKDEISIKSRNSWLCLTIQTMTHVQTSCLSPKKFTHFFIFNYYYHKIPLCHLKEHYLCYAQCWTLSSLYCLYCLYSHPNHLQTSLQRHSEL